VSFFLQSTAKRIKLALAFLIYKIIYKMSYSTSIATANTWEKYFLASAKATESDKLIESITRKLSDGTTYPEAHKIFSMEKSIFLMNFDKDVNEIHIYHSLDVLGGSLSNPKIFMVALNGFSTAGLPIVIGEDKVKGVSFNAPTWDAFMTVAGNAEAFKDLPASPAVQYRYNNFLPVPFQLMRAYVKSPAKDPASIGIAFINAYRKYDKLEEDPADSGADDEDYEVLDDEPTYPKFSEKFLCALLYVWGAANNKLANKLLHVAYPQSAFIQEWSKQRHEQCIASSVSPLLASPFQQSGSARDTIFIQAFTEMKETMESNRKGVTSIIEEKEKGFDKLDESFKNLILNASSEAPYDTKASEPSEFVKQFYKAKNLGRARTTVENFLFKDNCQWQVNQPLITALWSAHILWDRPEFPSNLSIFFCGDAPLGSNSSYVPKALGLQEKIEHTDLPKLIKQNIFVPTSIWEAIISLKNYLALITLLFTDDSRLVVMINSWVDHLLSNMRIYEFAHQTDAKFIPALLFRIDKAAMLFLRSCQITDDRKKVNDKILNMEASMQSIEEQNFHQLLPPGLLAIQKADEDEQERKRLKQDKGGVGGGGGDGDRDKNGKRLKGGKIKPDDKGKKVENKDDSYLLQKEENFSELFYKNKETAPKDGKKLICLSYHIRGFCYEKCDRVHAGLSAGAKIAFGNWTVECRQGKCAPGEDFAPRAEG
jgi:hypothetical protein